MSITLEEKRTAIANLAQMRKLVILCGIAAVGLMLVFLLGAFMLHESRAEVLPIRESDKQLLPTAASLTAAGEPTVAVSEQWQRVRQGSEETIKYAAYDENEKLLIQSELTLFASVDAAHVRFTERRGQLLDTDAESADDMFSWGDHSLYRMKPTVQNPEERFLVIRRGRYVLDVEMGHLAQGAQTANIVLPSLQQLDFALMDDGGSF